MSVIFHFLSVSSERNDPLSSRLLCLTAFSFSNQDVRALSNLITLSEMQKNILYPSVVFSHYTIRPIMINTQVVRLFSLKYTHYPHDEVCTEELLFCKLDPVGTQIIESTFLIVIRLLEHKMCWKEMTQKGIMNVWLTWALTSIENINVS